MTVRLYRVSLWVGLLCLLVSAPAKAEPRLGAAMGEWLQYNIHWTGMPGGRSTLSLTEQGKGYQIDVGLQSIGMVDFFYAVNDFVQVKGRLRGRHFLADSYLKKQDEGGRKRTTLVTFERAKHQATQKRNREKPKTIKKLAQGVTDPLSAFYTFRTIPQLKVGAHHLIPVLDSKKSYQARIDVIKKVKLNTPLGWFDTVLVHTHLKSSDIFRQKAPIKIWFTDDQRRLPVRVETSIPIGFVAADLVAYRDGMGGQQQMDD
ncbi:DUF3108 domain-containing protein [Magnetococcus sp. PR-3]|uniref:DUF3108 domain-containing protein n=1 Tax=Magnetococcus sp. PR-3 TaxID=3120355 RepID=UPI002FCE360D